MHCEREKQREYYLPETYTSLYLFVLALVFFFTSSSVFACAFVSCTVKYCVKQRWCAGSLSESAPQPSGDSLGLLASYFPLQSYSRTPRIILGFTIMENGEKVVSASKMHCLPARSPALIVSLACQESTQTCSLMYTNMKLLSSRQDECYNYIKVLVPRNDETLFACGTNAFNPTCRNYKVRYRAFVGWLLASITDKSLYYSSYDKRLADPLCVI